jgi:hypothetical protein
MTTPQDVFTWARKYNNNKDTFDRIWHSPTFDSLRSAMNSRGSAASKGLALVTTVGRAALSLIPIPVLGAVLQNVEQSVEGRIRSYFHSKKVPAGDATTFAGQDLTNFVKFNLKELPSSADLDRYRRKVEDAAEELNRRIQSFDSDRQAALTTSSPCDAFANVALAATQLDRRVFKLRKATTDLRILLDATDRWLDSYSVALEAGFTAKFNRLLCDQVTADSQNPDFWSFHSQCGEWCTFNLGKRTMRSDEPGRLREALIYATRFVGEQAKADISVFMSTNSDSYSTAGGGAGFGAKTGGS